MTKINQLEINKMNHPEWIVTIEGNRDLEIKVSYDPLKDILIFIGQLRRVAQSLDLVRKEVNVVDVSTDEKMLEVLADVHKQLLQRLETLSDLKERFKTIKIIGYQDEE